MAWYDMVLFIIQAFVLPILVLIQFCVGMHRYKNAKRQFALKGTEFWAKEQKRIRKSLIILGIVLWIYFLLALSVIPFFL